MNTDQLTLVITIGVALFFGYKIVSYLFDIFGWGPQDEDEEP
ncbi:MAG TPA: hypothetical protein PKV71_10265 [Calditrichia bacterium]|nr:hypothetical protein [Calditrichia bacterium]HQV32251.1 hypothetical protein [Calditrichia bacterium]